MQRLCFSQPPLIFRLFYIYAELFCFVSFFNLRHFFRYARTYVRTGSYAPGPPKQKLESWNSLVYGVLRLPQKRDLPVNLLPRQAGQR